MLLIVHYTRLGALNPREVASFSRQLLATPIQALLSSWLRVTLERNSAASNSAGTHSRELMARQRFERIGQNPVFLPSVEIEVPPFVLVYFKTFCFHSFPQEFPVPSLQ